MICADRWSTPHSWVIGGFPSECMRLSPKATLFVTFLIILIGLLILLNLSALRENIATTCIVGILLVVSILVGLSIRQRFILRSWKSADLTVVRIEIRERLDGTQERLSQRVYRWRVRVECKTKADLGKEKIVIPDDLGRQFLSESLAKSAVFRIIDENRISVLRNPRNTDRCVINWD